MKRFLNFKPRQTGHLVHYIAVGADLDPLADAGRDLVVGDAEVHPGLEPVQVGQSQAVPRVGRHLVSRYVDLT